MIFEIDPLGNIIFVNEHAFQLFGYEEDDFRETFNCFKHIAPEDHNRVRENLEKLIQGETSPGNEYTAVKKDGTRFPVVIYAGTVTKNNHLTGFNGIIIDITQRKKIENEIRFVYEALEEREKMYRTFFESTSDFVFLKAYNGQYLFANTSYLNFFGKFYLPLVWLEPENDSDTCQIVGGIETLLIAEDNKELCRLSMRVLRDHGYSVLAAMDGATAVQMFREHKDEVKLIILDVVMPKMNGKEAYEAIKRIEPSVKVIFTSGYTDDIVIERGIANEEFDFLGKPLTPVTLLKKIRDVLDR